MLKKSVFNNYSVADPGFPVGGHGPIRGVCGPIGGVDPQCGHLLAKMNGKTKELGPMGGHVPDTPPRSANATGPHTGPMIVDFLFLGKAAQYMPTFNIKSTQGLLLILCLILETFKFE